MRKLFIQFYLLLVTCFIVAVIMVGAVYKQAVDKVGERYLSDLLRTSLSLIEAELKGVPPQMWGEMLARADNDLSFHIKVEPLSQYSLDDESYQALANGDIVMIEDSYLFLQRISNSDYVLVAGPLRYLFFLHQLKWFDYALLAFVGLSLALPVFLWMRPHWRDLSALERAATRLGAGQFDTRVNLSERSGVARLGLAFNRMIDSINELLASKKSLTNAVAHELRTPLARLRYRLALLENADTAAMERDLNAIDSLIEELLLHARLDRPEMTLALSQLDAVPWARTRLADIGAIEPELDWVLATDASTPLSIQADKHLLSRALDNLLTNARRYARTTVQVKLAEDRDGWALSVEDDGPGIPAEDRDRVFEPFVRLDESRARHTGGHGLGLAIVAGIARAHHGSISVDNDGALGGARFTLRWPKPVVVHSVTPGNIPATDDR